MIVVEERLTELFELLPAREFTDSKGVVHNVPKPFYHFGDGKEANDWIKLRQNNTWPLIYQTSYRGDIQRKGRIFETDLELILCVQTESTILNDVRWATSYRNILRPLLEDVQTVLETSGIILSEFNYRIENFPNYSESESKDKNAFISIVDAIKLTLPCKINDQCRSKYIKFKNI